MSAAAGSSHEGPFQRIDTSSARLENPLPPNNPRTPGGAGGRFLYSNSEEKITTTTPTTTDSFCHISKVGEFCWLDAEEHIGTPGHLENFAQFLIQTWKFRGARRFIDYYSIQLVYSEAVQIMIEMEFPTENPIRSPARVLAYRVKGLFLDTSGHDGRRLLDSENLGGGGV